MCTGVLVWFKVSEKILNLLTVGRRKFMNLYIHHPLKNIKSLQEYNTMTRKFIKHKFGIGWKCV